MGLSRTVSLFLSLSLLVLARCGDLQSVAPAHVPVEAFEGPAFEWDGDEEREDCNQDVALLQVHLDFGADTSQMTTTRGSPADAVTDGRPQQRLAAEGGGHKLAAEGSRPQKYLAAEGDRPKLLEAEGCPLLLQLVPAFVTMICIGFVLLIIGFSTWSSSPAEITRSLMMLFFFVSGNSFMIVVPDSYELSVAIGMDASWSGFLVGIVHWGDALGVLVAAMQLHMVPDLWRDSGRIHLCTAAFVMMSGAVFYVCCTWRVSRSKDGATSALLLLASRMLLGIGCGYAYQLMGVMLQKVTPYAEVPREFSRMAFWVTIGIGSGPMVAALGRSLDFCSTVPTALPRFEISGHISVVLSMGVLVGLLLFYPNLKSPLSEPQLQTTNQAQESSVSMPSSQRYIVLLSGFALNTIRSYVVAAVEVATALLLQQNFGWTPIPIGITIGVTFLFAMPVRLVFTCIQDWFSDARWVRIVIIVSLVGTVMFFKKASEVLPHGVALVCGDMIVFPFAYLAEGLSMGVMMQHAMPDGAFLDTNSIILIRELCSAFIRGFGAWVSRYSIENGGGQDVYAGTQTLSCVAFLVIFEFGMGPYMRTDQKKI